MMTTNTLEIIDTFPAFLDYWEKCWDLPLAEQIEHWAQDYLSPWPALLTAQIEDYTEQDIDWSEIAQEKVFPYLAERLPAMAMARENLLSLGQDMYGRTLLTLGIDFSAVFVIHVGIGCGAGWATRYLGSPAVLFGLENIAESGWTDRSAIAGLIAHELAHLAHYEWRDREKISTGSGPWWQLYEEGFAHHCEGLVVGGPIWHQMKGDADWLDWCQRNRGWLAEEFLSRVDADESVTPFFGSWFSLRGKKQAGYFLGSEIVQQLAVDSTLGEIAMLENIEHVIRPILQVWVSNC